MEEDRKRGVPNFSFHLSTGPKSIIWLHVGPKNAQTTAQLYSSHTLGK